MDKMAMWIFIVFGIVMIGIGQYKRVQQMEARVAAGMIDHDPLVNRIKQYNKKNDEKKGIANTVSNVKSRMFDSSDPLKAGSIDPQAVDVPEDAFAPEPTKSPMESFSTVKKDVKPGKLPTPDSFPAKVPPAENTEIYSSNPGFYPPLAASAPSKDKSAAGSASQEQSGEIKPYYPPVGAAR